MRIQPCAHSRSQNHGGFRLLDHRRPAQPRASPQRIALVNGAIHVSPRFIEEHAPRALPRSRGRRGRCGQEFLLGKQLPYIGVAMVNFAIMFVMSQFVFGVPLKGSFLTLVIGVLIYVTATTSYGLVISAFAKTQIAALFGTAILTILPATQFSGMTTPVSSLSGMAQYMGLAFPMTYFVPISVGTFTKGLGFDDLVGSLAMLAAFVPILTLLSFLLLRKQEH